MNIAEKARFDALTVALEKNAIAMQTMATAHIELANKLRGIHAQLNKINRSLLEREAE